MSKEDRKRILDLAAACVLRDRNATHGEAEDNFATIAEYWTTHLHARGLLPKGVALAREDVAIMSAQIKLARLAQSFDHEDNWVDGAGYMACGGGCAADRRRAGEIYSPPVGALVPPQVAQELRHQMGLTDGFDPARPGPDRSVATVTHGVPGHPRYCACDRCAVVTDGNGMPAVAEPTMIPTGSKVFTGHQEADELLSFLRSGDLPTGCSIRGLLFGPGGEALSVEAPGTYAGSGFLLKPGKTFAEIAEEFRRVYSPARSVSLLPPATATPAEIQKFFEDVQAAGVRTKENNHLFYDLDREKAMKRELNFREGVLSPPPPCTCEGPHYSRCTPNAT